MTIKDIAREAGYAVGTVSRVLNKNPNVSPAARARILDVVHSHNFQPNANAKHLKQQASYGIALIVKGRQNMLFTALVEKAQNLIEAAGYPSTIYYIDEEANEVEQAILLCTERRPYGILFLGSNLEHFTPELEALGVPCVLLTNSAASLDIANLSSVTVDDSAAAAKMIEYLCAQGHRRIGVIGGRPEISRPSFSRLMGCQSAFAAHKLPFDPALQYAPARFSLQGGYAAMEQLLGLYPTLTAVFAMSDLMALGAVRALQDHGLRVPQDISVTGYDGLDIGRYSVPRLTTIRQNVDRIATRGVEILTHCIEDNHGATHELVPFELVQSESAGPVKDK